MTDQTANIVGLGLDLGTRNLGWCVVHWSREAGFRCQAAGLIGTEKDKNAIRVTLDDLRRRRLIHKQLAQLIEEHKPNVVGYETYHVFDDILVDKLKEEAKRLLGLFGGKTQAMMGPDQLRDALSTRLYGPLLERLSVLTEIISKMGQTRGRGDAAKVLAVQGVVETIGFERNLKLSPHTPADLKQRAVGRKGASKEDVAEGLKKLIHGLEAALSALPESRQNHAYDAAGHAVIAIEGGVYG